MDNIRELYNKGIWALNSNDITLQRNTLWEINENFDNTDKLSVFNNIKKIILDPKHTSFLELTPEEVTINLRCHCQVLWEKLHTNMPVCSIEAINFLSCYSFQFQPQTIIYCTSTHTLNVSSLLKTIDYILEGAEKIFHLDVERYKQGLLILKSLHKLLNNKPTENDFYDNLGYGLEIFREIAKKINTDPRTYQIQDNIFLGIKLAIDFLSWNNQTNHQYHSY